jgi:hypothetical protein
MSVKRVQKSNHLIKALFHKSVHENKTHQHDHHRMKRNRGTEEAVVRMETFFIFTQFKYFRHGNVIMKGFSLESAYDLFVLFFSLFIPHLCSHHSCVCVDANMETFHEYFTRLFNAWRTSAHNKKHIWMKYYAATQWHKQRLICL